MRNGLKIVLYNVLPWVQVTPGAVERLSEAEAIGAVKPKFGAL